MTRIDIHRNAAASTRVLVLWNDTVRKEATDSGVPEPVLELIKIRASQLNGCSFCLDMHITEARKGGEDQRRIDLLPAWRETALYTEPERAVLALTETITALAVHRDVPDAELEAVRAHFDDKQTSAIVMSIAVINSWNRLGVTAHLDLP